MSIKQAIEALEELIEYAETAGFDWSLDNARAALAALRSMPAEPPDWSNVGRLLDAVSAATAGRYMVGTTNWAAFICRQMKPATPHTEAVRMSEAEIQAIWSAKDTPLQQSKLSAFGMDRIRAVEQATAARLGVKLGDV